MDDYALTALTVGDTAYVDGRADGALAAVRVERLTSTQVVTDRGARYRIKDGYEVGRDGDMWSVHPRLLVRTPDLDRRYAAQRDERQRKSLARTLSDKLAGLSLDQLRQIEQIVGGGQDGQ